MTLIRRIAFVPVLLVALAACGGDDDAATTTAGGEGGEGGASEVQASAVGFAFDPATVEVTAGGSVTWTNEDNTAHTVTAGAPGEPSGDFETLSLDGGGSGSLTFPETGSFPFFCEIHPAMVVTVEVG